jgi:hypothetical protein
VGLTLVNGYSSTISTTIMFYSPEACGGEGGNFECMGWWNIQPGGSAFVFANDVGDLNRFWYFFAEAADAVWSGPFGHAVPTHAFGGDDACWGLGVGAGSEWRQVGYFEKDVGDADNYTLTFVP